jgi:molybdopterin-binding protein
VKALPQLLFGMRGTRREGFPFSNSTASWLESSPLLARAGKLRLTRQALEKPGIEFWQQSSDSVQISASVEKMVSDKVGSDAVIGTATGVVRSVITTGSVNRMNLKEEDNIFSVIKVTRVSIETE